MLTTITNIPRIMRTHSWDNGARLMEIWFSGPSATTPAYSDPETNTIKMDTWALTFPRAKDVFDQIISERIWANAAAQKEITKMLRRKGFLSGASLIFGELDHPVELQDKDYVNYRVVNNPFDSDLDDMTAALGNFTFRVVVAGSVTASITNLEDYEVTITEVGIYIRDSYDFNDDQFLGFWNEDTDEVSAINPLVGTQISNSNFREWRSINNKGGDFEVFSDIKRIILDTPDIFIIKNI